MAKSTIPECIEYFEPNNINLYDFDYEDLCISVRLTARIPLRRNYTESPGTINFSWDGKSKTVSFIDGGKDYISTFYTDVSAKDAYNGGDPEAFGIESIAMDYNSWYLPEFTIKFVDIRASALFKTTVEADNDERSNVSDFFKLFFTFPYPLFTITLKGFYGKAITYSLTVSDFRSTFNSGSGNFEATAKFIGNSFNFLADVPMKYLFIAPYLKNYKLEKISSDNDVFSFTEILKRLVDAKNVVSEIANGNSDISKKLTENAEKQANYEKEKNYLEQIKADLASKKNGYMDTTDTLIVMDGYDAKFNRDTDADIDPHLQAMPYSGQVEEMKEFDSDFDYYVDEKGKKIFYAFGGSADNGKKRPTELNATIADLNNKEALSAEYNEVGDRISYCMLKVGTWKIDELNKSIEDVEADIKQGEEDLKDEIDKKIQEALGFKCTIKFIFETIFAHLKLFVKEYGDVLDDINANNGRVLMSADLYNTDLSNKQKTKVAPYPMVYKTVKPKNIIFPGDYDGNSIIRNLEEVKYVENIFDAAKDAYAKYLAEFARMNSNEFEANHITKKFSYIPTMVSDFYHSETNPYKDVFTGDMNVEDKAKRVLAAFGTRYALLNICGDEELIQGPSTIMFAKIEAYNVYMTNHGDKDWVKELIAISPTELLTKLLGCLKENPFGNSPKEILNNSTGAIMFKNYTSNNTENSVGLPYNYEKLSDALNAGKGVKNTTTNLSEFRTASTIKQRETVYKNHQKDLEDCVTFLTQEEWDAWNSAVDDVIGANSEAATIIGEGDEKSSYQKLSSLLPDSANCTPLKTLASIFDIEVKNSEGKYQTIRDADKKYKAIPTAKVLIGTHNSEQYEVDIISLYKILTGENFGSPTPELIRKYFNFDDFDKNLNDILAYFLFVSMYEFKLKSDYSYRDENDKRCHALLYDDDFDTSDGDIPGPKYDNKIYGQIGPTCISSLEAGFIGFMYYFYDKKHCDPCLGKTIEKGENNNHTYAGRIYKGQPSIEKSLKEKYVKYYKDNFGGNKVLNLVKSVAAKIKNSDIGGDWAIKIKDDILRNDATNDVLALYDNFITTKVYVITPFMHDAMNFGTYYDNSFNENYESNFYNASDSRSDYVREVIQRNNSDTDKTSGGAKRNLDSMTVQTFILELKELYQLETENEAIENDVDINNLKATSGQKLAIYLTLKTLYDRWQLSENSLKNIATDNVDFSNWKYYNTYRHDIGSEYIIDPNTFFEEIQKVMDAKGGASENMSVYQFMSNICKANDLTFLSFPIDVFSISGDEAKAYFDTYTYMEGMGHKQMVPTFCAYYENKPSEHLDHGESSEYEDDGADFTKDASVIMKNGWSGNKIPVFGVTYGYQEQRMFQNINVGMEAPKNTEYSILSKLFVAKKGQARSVANIGTFGQNLYNVFANNSYTCEVEGLGNFCIFPLMYFQLNNIPMFRGTYVIIRVMHSISRGQARTKFVGVRMNKTCVPFLKKLYDIADLTKTYDFNGEIPGFKGGNKGFVGSPDSTAYQEKYGRALNINVKGGLGGSVGNNTIAGDVTSAPLGSGEDSGALIQIPGGPSISGIHELRGLGGNQTDNELMKKVLANTDYFMVRGGTWYKQGGKSGQCTAGPRTFYSNSGYDTIEQIQNVAWVKTHRTWTDYAICCAWPNGSASSAKKTTTRPSRFAGAEEFKTGGRTWLHKKTEYPIYPIAHGTPKWINSLAKNGGVRPGDVVTCYTCNSSQHACMWNGEQWVSDYYQHDNAYPYGSGKWLNGSTANITLIDECKAYNTKDWSAVLWRRVGYQDSRFGTGIASLY